MSAEMLSGSYLSVMEANSQDVFRDEIVRFANGLGFDYVSAMTVVDLSMTQSEFIAVDNMPAPMVDAVVQVATYRRDPVMQHCKKGTVPIIWDQDTYTNIGMGDHWEAQAAFGYRTGIALAMHFPEGRHFVMGVDRQDTLPTDRTDLTRIVADFQLFAVHAQDAAMRLFAPKDMQLERPKLTPRELEALRWTMDGKTAWEVGAILGISERTAVLHIQNSMQKLGATSKHQAVLKALRLGLIH